MLVKRFYIEFIKGNGPSQTHQMLFLHQKLFMVFVYQHLFHFFNTKAHVSVTDSFRLSHLAAKAIKAFFVKTVKPIFNYSDVSVVQRLAQNAKVAGSNHGMGFSKMMLDQRTASQASVNLMRSVAI